MCNESSRGRASQTNEAANALDMTFRRQSRWLAENGNALDSSNELVEQYGLLLARYRRFQVPHGNEGS